MTHRVLERETMKWTEMLARNSMVRQLTVAATSSVRSATQSKAEQEQKDNLYALSRTVVDNTTLPSGPTSKTFGVHSVHRG